MILGNEPFMAVMASVGVGKKAASGSISLEVREKSTEFLWVRGRTGVLERQ